jgi:hypothetical protein
VCAVALLTLSAGAGSPATIARGVGYPNAVAFADATHGVLGTSDGIALTSDGGRTWRLVRRTRPRVCEVAVVGHLWYAQLSNGEALRSRDSGSTWAATTHSLWPRIACPSFVNWVGIRATPVDPTWSVRMTGPAAGFQGKWVSRKLNGRWKRVACTNMAEKMPCGRPSYGGISLYGYPQGIAGNASGFGLIWEGRGVLWQTRNGGRHWTVARAGEVSDEDFASWASVLPRGGVGCVLLGNAGVRARLVVTTDAGRSWHVVHRWR